MTPRWPIGGNLQWLVTVLYGSYISRRSLLLVLLKSSGTQGTYLRGSGGGRGVAGTGPVPVPCFATA